MTIRDRHIAMEPHNNSLHGPLDISVTALVFATAAPETGARELKR